MHRASPSFRRTSASCGSLTLAVAALAAPCCAQDHAPNLIPGAYPYAASVVAKAQHGDSGMKNLSAAPVLKVIAPDPPSPAMALPDRRSTIDQMMESHEFTFGRNRRAANYAGSRPSAGTGLDLDAVKLRVSRDKVLLKAEWTFN
jgi:hypothetical protein